MEILTTTGYSKNGYGAWLNKIMKKSPSEWVMIHDHDIFLANPRWYRIVMENIKRAQNAGLLTCVTNRIGNKAQVVDGVDPENYDLRYHWKIAAEQEGKPLELARQPISGVVMVTSKTAWRAAGGFRESGIFGVDNDYYRRIKRAGYRVYIMRDLYVFHRYRATQKNN